MTEDELEQYLALRQQWELERAAAEPPDPLAEAMAQPTESLNSRHRRELAERDREWERERAERLALQQEAAAVPGWVTQLRTEIEEARSSLFESVIDGICQVVAEMKSRGEKRLEDALRPLRDEQAEAIERATEILREEFKVAIAKAAVAGDFVVRAADGGVDVFASMRKNRDQFRNAMRRTEAAASASEGMTIAGTSSVN